MGTAEQPPLVPSGGEVQYREHRREGLRALGVFVRLGEVEVHGLICEHAREMLEQWTQGTVRITERFCWFAGTSSA